MTKPGLGKKVALIGAPLGFGAGTVGSELGVEAMRLAPLRGRRLIDVVRGLGYEAVDKGNVEILKPRDLARPGENPRYLPEMLAS